MGTGKNPSPLAVGFLVPTKVGCHWLWYFFTCPIHSYSPQTHSIIQYESTSASNPKNKRNRDTLNVSASLLQKHWKGPYFPYFQKNGPYFPYFQNSKVLTLRLAAPHLVSAAAGDGQAPPSQSATAALAQQEEQELHRLTFGNLS